MAYSALTICGNKLRGSDFLQGTKLLYNLGAPHQLVKAEVNKWSWDSEMALFFTRLEESGSCHGVNCENLLVVERKNANREAFSNT